MRRIAIVLGWTLVLGVASADAESRYSLRGNGEAVTSQRADHRARGGAEAATPIPSLSGNPASLVFAQQTSFFGTYDTEWIRTEETVSNAVRKEYSGLVPNLGLVFPLPREWRFGIGLLVTRRRGGTIEQDATVNDGSGGTITYRQEFDGNGNEIRIPFLLARDIGGVQVGSGIDLVLLRSENRWRNDFSQVTDPGGFLDSEDTDETNLGGVAWRTGVRVPVGERFAFGGWVSIPTKLSGERILSSDQAGTSADFTQDLEVESHPIYSLGVEIVALPRVRVAADWTYEPWTDADRLSPIDEFVDVNRLAFGVEWRPEERRGALNWPVRAGYRTELLHVLDAAGNEVREHVLSAGSGFGIAGGRGDIDWYVEYGWRGQADDSEYQEHVVRFGVTLTGLEQWSRTPRPQGEDDW
jgi:hypothetical protein